jgi:alkylhydroperoxidase/carboxymuconolactone decarboxylase family protein YurZ
LISDSALIGLRCSTFHPLRAIRHDRVRATIGQGAGLMLKPVYQEMLRRLTLGDERAVGRVLCGGSVDAPLLDDKTTALVRLACLVAIESDGPSLHPAIDECHAAGAEGDEMIEVVEAVTPVIGSVRVHNATASIIAALRVRH